MSKSRLGLATASEPWIESDTLFQISVELQMAQVQTNQDIVWLRGLLKDRLMSQ